MLSLVSLSLAACNKVAPELSFEETLQVYSKQQEPLLKLADFMYSEGQLKSSLKMKAHGNDQEAFHGDIALDADSISEKTTGNSDTTLKLALDLNGDTVEKGGIGKINTHFTLNSLVKDHALFLKLSDFSLNADQEQLKGMISAVVNGLKDKWLTLNTPELKELLQASTQQHFSLWQRPELYQANPLFYTGVVSTKYDGNPAWKVDFNTDEIRKFILEIYDLAQNESGTLGSGNEELLLAQQQMKEEMKQILSQLRFENTEAYFVIRSADKVDFILKNSDIAFDTMKIQMKQLVKGKNTEIQLLLTPAESQESLKIRLHFTASGKGKWEGELNAWQQEEKNWKELFNIKGNLKARLSDEYFSITPEFKYSSGKTQAHFSFEYQVEKTEGHSFTAPEGAQDLAEVFGALAGMMGAPALGLPTPEQAAQTHEEISG